MEKFNPNVIFVGLGQFHQFHPFRAVILDKAILSLSFFFGVAEVWHLGGLVPKANNSQLTVSFDRLFDIVEV